MSFTAAACAIHYPNLVSNTRKCSRQDDDASNLGDFYLQQKGGLHGFTITNVENEVVITLMSENVDLVHTQLAELFLPIN